MQPQQMELPVSSRDLAEVDTILDRAIASGNPLIATEYGNQLSKAMAMKGVALAKLFSGMSDNWSLFRSAGIQEDFKDFVDAHMFIKGRTATKYADMYKSVFENEKVSQSVRDQLQGKPMTTLLLLTAAVREGSLDEDDLEKVVILDHSGVHDLVRDARGEATNSHTAITGRLVQRDHSSYPKGAIVVFGGSEIEAIGYLKLDPTTDAGQKFLQRIINRLGLEDIR
jgi:hypothetical protein